MVIGTKRNKSMSNPFFFSRPGKIPIVLHAPHSSIIIPEKFRSDFVLNKTELQHEAQWMADLWTDELFPLNDERFWIQQSRVSRLVVDVERFSDETMEGMTQYGMAAVYTKTSAGDALKNLTLEKKELYLDTFYQPYHAALDQTAQQIIEQYRQFLLIDCHSFPSEPRYYEDQAPNRPDICIGVNEKTTPDWIVELLQKQFSDYGYSVKINTPFAGSLVPNILYGTPEESRCSSVMFEINRKIYMNETTFEKLPAFDIVAGQIQNVIDLLVSEYLKRIK